MPRGRKKISPEAGSEEVKVDITPSPEEEVETTEHEESESDGEPQSNDDEPEHDESESDEVEPEVEESSDEQGEEPEEEDDNEADENLEKFADEILSISKKEQGRQAGRQAGHKGYVDAFERKVDELAMRVLLHEDDPEALAFSDISENFQGKVLSKVREMQREEQARKAAEDNAGQQELEDRLFARIVNHQRHREAKKELSALLSDVPTKQLPKVQRAIQNIAKETSGLSARQLFDLASLEAGNKSSPSKKHLGSVTPQGKGRTVKKAAVTDISQISDEQALKMPTGALAALVINQR